MTITERCAIGSWRLIFFITITGVFFIYTDYIYEAHRFYVQSKDDIFSRFQYFNNSLGAKFTIKTEGCTIPGMEPFDDSVKMYFNVMDDAEKSNWKCIDEDRPFIKRNRTHLWVVKENALFYVPNKKRFSCCCQNFYSPDGNVVTHKRQLIFGNCVNFTGSLKINDEFVRVTCYYNRALVYKNVFLFALKKDFQQNNGESEDIYKTKLKYNVIVLGIDNVSRLNFHRAMPKTLSFLKNKDAVELLGYTKVGYNTFPNIVAMLTGYKLNRLRTICYPHLNSTFDHCSFAWTWFKKAGYYTAFGEDSAGGRGIFNYGAKGFIYPPTDYYTQMFTLTTKETPFNKDIGAKCVGDRYFFQIILDYVKDILWVQKSSKMFGFFWSSSLSHGYLNTPTLMDDGYLDFFKHLESFNFLNTSIIFLVSDHGMRWGKIRFTKQGRLEEMLPFVFVLAPPSFKYTYSAAYKNLKENSKRLTSPLDIYYTLLDLIDLSNIEADTINLKTKENYTENLGISLFLPIPNNRTCNISGIDEEWCACIKTQTLAQKPKEVTEVAHRLVDEINAMVQKHPQCAKLRLDKIVDVSELVTNKLRAKPKELSWREFLVVLRMWPGGGLFEGTLRFDGNNWIRRGTISRINYGFHSDCVTESEIKPYCYCQ